MKLCPKCKTSKNDVDFYSTPKRSDGLSGWCKCCYRAHNKKMYLKNPHRTTDIIKPRRVAIRECKRQEQIVKYGIALVEIMDTLDGIEGF